MGQGIKQRQIEDSRQTPLRVIIVGFGGVGRSFARLVERRRVELRSNYDLDIEVVGMADSKGALAGAKRLDLKRMLRLKETKGVVADDENRLDTLSMIENTKADAVLELTPTNPKTGEPGLSNILTALKSGKHVVTANKGPLVVAYPRLMKIAEANSVELRYSAAVGGANPVLAFGEECAKSEPVVMVEAILNRTSNYILTQMEESALPFEEILDETRRSGLAEPDPSLDIDGIDTASKIVIVANHVMKRNAYLTEVDPIESIREVSMEQVEDAKKKGKLIRLVGLIGRKLEVRLTELEEKDPLAVKGTADATRYHCKYSGPRLVGSNVGGPMYTSCGVLRDLVHIQRNSSRI